MDPYRAPQSPPPPPRDPMRVVLIVAGSLAGLIAAGAVALGVLDRTRPQAASASAEVDAGGVIASECTPQECGPSPPLYCPDGVAPRCARRNGACGWDLPPECTTEPPRTVRAEPAAADTGVAMVATDAPVWPRGGNLLQQASALSLAGDNAGARALLEPHVFGGHGSADEVRMLKGICKSMHDAECVAAIEKRYR